jgi:HK97 family phage prohead protease/HK97 family phage major capsid protein
MEKIFNLTSTFKALSEDDDGSVHICGMASTADKDRANDVISAEAWTKGGLANFEKNPIILFNHNYDKPIGRATGLKVTENGLELKAKISKSAPDHVAQLVKEGILGAFSVGFRVKDADYIQETDGLKIKDAELFEVSVVSVPCNQAATFSLSKSFDSMAEYEEFKKTFKSTNREDLAGQFLAKEDVKASSVASDSPDGAELAQKEIKMSEVNTPEIDLEAFAKKVAEETAAKIAMKQAEEKAAAQKAVEEQTAKAAAEAEVKAAQEEEVKSAIKLGVESGAERLMADLEAKLNEKDAKIDEVIKGFAVQLEEKNDELAKIRESKRVFGDRESRDGDLSKWGKDFMHAHLLGVMTGKGISGTNFGRSVFEKAGMAYDSTDPNIATEVSRQIEKEIVLNLRTAQLFREVQINSASQVLPIQTDTNTASWQTGAATAGNLENRTQVSANTYQASQVVLQAYRLISQTFMDNHVDEEVLINLMPMLVDSVARAHARAVDSAILNGNGTFSGIEGFATASSGGALDLDGATLAAGNSATLTAAMLLQARKDMGKYGIMPSDVAYIVSQKRYYDLLADPEFADITDVGSDIATKVTGTIGAVYGSPVIISDNFEAEVAGASVAYAVALRNYVIPRLRGVTVEQDYEVGNQRRVIVASQSLGFNELVADAAGNRSAVKVVATA